jgi:flavin reductase (DIM6/NTAB) family NADH-FMN oxidoreductase RutF
MFKKISNEGFYHLIGHGPCVIITSNFDGKINAAPIAWNMPVNDEPPMLAIAVAESHLTAELIKKSNEFVVNIPDVKLLPLIKSTGKVSGRKTDKIKNFKINTETGIEVKTPHLTNAIAFIECRVQEKRFYSGVILFIGKVIYAAAKPGLYNGIWKTKAKTLHHLGGSSFALTGKRVKF